MFGVSSVLLVIARTHSLTLAGLLVACATLPGALTGPLLGAWLDVTTSRRRLLILDRLVTLLALAALLRAAGHAPDWTLPLIGVVYGITSPLSAGATASVMPEVAGADLIGVAYTFEATSINIAFIVGPALAGLIAGFGGPAAALETQMAIGAVIALAIAGDRTFELRPPGAERAPGVREAAAEGLRSLWHIAPLRRNALTSIVYVCAWGTLNVSFPAYALSVGARAHAAGYMWAGISLGSLVSAFVLRSPARRVSERGLIAGSFLMMALSVLVWPVAGDLAAALALVTLTGFLEGPSLVALIGARQRLAPAHLRNQLFATITSLNLAGAAVGAAIAGPVHSTLGTTATVYCFALLMAVAAAIVLSGTTGRGTATPNEA